MSRAFSLECRLTWLKEKLTLAQATCRSDFQRSLIFIVSSLNSICCNCGFNKTKINSDWPVVAGFREMSTIECVIGVATRH